MAFTRAWSLATPADTDLANVLGSAIRNLREDIEERLEIDHEWTNATDGGKHKKVTFVDPLGVKPTAVTDEGYLYTKNVSSKAELFWEDEDGNEVQITEVGAINPAGLAALANDVALAGKETGGTARDLVQVGGGDLVELGDASVGVILLYKENLQAKRSAEAVRNLAQRIPRSHLAGMQLSNSGINDISASRGECADFTNAQMLYNDNNPLTKQIDAAWSAGTNAGGYGGAVPIAVDTWYHYYAIGKLDGTTDYGFDNHTAATGLLAAASGYTLYRRIGSVLTDPSTATTIVAFIQEGDEVLWKSPTIEINNDVVNSSSILRTVKVPLGFRCHALLNTVYNANGLGDYLYITSPDVDDDAASNTAAPLASMSGEADNITHTVGYGAVHPRTNTIQQIRLVSTNSENVRVSTIGYIDRRGQDD